MSRKNRRSPGTRLAGAVMLFYFLAFLLLAVREGDMTGLILALAVPGIIFLGTWLMPRLFPADRLLLALTNFLCALGVLVLYATNPDAARQQVIAYGIGVGAMIVCIYLVRTVRSWAPLVPVMAFFGLLFLALPLLFGSEINGAKNWVSVFGISFQPSEAVKIVLVILLAFCLSRRKMIPALAFTLACLAVLMLQRDLGTALMYFGTALLLYWASSGNWLITLLGIAGGGAAAWGGYMMFPHVRRRVAVWINPWRDYENAGYQIVQGLVAIASGGLFGVGLGLGAPTAIPVYTSDFIFAVICEQFGLIFGCCVLLVYVALIWRGTTIAMAARKSFHGLMAMGATILIGLQTFTIIGGVLKLFPLTGVTMPFVSYGGTSLIASMCLIGLIQGVESLNEEDLEEDTHLAMLSR